jgi:hypothetical protein
MIELILPLITLGIFSGLLSGFFGIGSGIILVPAYIFLFEYLGFSPEVIPYMATGSSGATMVFAISSGAYVHNSNKNVELNIIKFMIPGIIIGTILGRFASLEIGFENVNLLISIFLIAVAFQLALNFEPKKVSVNSSVFEKTIGSSSMGFLASIVGIGGGIIMVPYFKYRGSTMHKAIGNSSTLGWFIALTMTITAFFVYPETEEDIPYAFGSLYVPAILIVGLTSIYFAKVGANLSSKSEDKTLRYAFALLVIIGASRIFLKNFI